MLKSWSIQNFKPIVDSGDLKLAPVTVLAGRNSSGKSSLIQSILMIAQTLSSRILDRPLLPNGLLVQLGTIEDILSEQTGLRTLTVGFEQKIEMTELGTASGARLIKLPDGKVTTRLSSNIESARVVARFQSASGNGVSSSAIEAAKVNIESVTLEMMTSPPAYRQPSLPFEVDVLLPDFSIDIKRLPRKEFEEFLKNVPSEYQQSTSYATRESDYLGTLHLKSRSSDAHIPGPFLVTLSHFLPARLIRKYIVEERRKSRLMHILSPALDGVWGNSERAIETLKVRLADSLDLESPISYNLKEAVIDLCKDEDIQEPFAGQTLLDLIRWYWSLKLGRKKRTVGNKFKGIIIQNVLEEQLQGNSENDRGIEALEIVNNNIYVNSIEVVIGQITQFFASKIRYLGPLRADPQTSQRFAPSSELDDVGQKGEYAAAVYDANQNARIRWYNPFKDEVQEGTLKVALDTWIKYLGVANRVQIQEAGQSGVSWQVVHMEGHKPLPLAAVGTGVSQILPVLVMGLLAPSNTLLLVEQPELHLHPGVQARLGDFFMGLAKCDKQCLIETHSENLVSQLRYHIVQAGGQENSDCLIYFVDQDQQGAAQFNPIEISPQGNILNWPDGFFDETMLQEDRITSASIKKRAEKARNG